MADQVTGREILDMVVGKNTPEGAGGEGVIPNLLKMFANLPPTPMENMKPTQQAAATPEATQENIAQSIANPEPPPKRKYNFLGAK